MRSLKLLQAPVLALAIGVGASIALRGSPGTASGPANLPPPGMTLTDARINVPSLSGAYLPLLAPDSTTGVLVLSPSCQACEAHLPTYPAVLNALRSQGIATRVVVALGRLPHPAFIDSLPRDHVIIPDSTGHLLDRLQTWFVPSLVMIDAAETVDTVFSTLGDWPPSPEALSSRSGVPLQSNHPGGTP